MVVVLSEGKWNDGAGTLGMNYGAHDYTDRYPPGLNLRPDSEDHGRLLSILRQMALDSRSKIDSRFDSWDAIDEHLTSYIDLSAQQKEDEAVEGYVKKKPIQIVVPMSQAVLEVLLTYMTAAFLEDPIFRYDWVGDEDALGCILLERLVEVQTRRSKVGLALHTQWRDAFALGYGVVSPQWYQTYGTRTVIRDVTRKNWLGKTIKVGEEETLESVLLEEGNLVYNINPRYFLPDPNVSISDVQRGEGTGWIKRTNYVNLLGEEEHNKNLFNVKYIQYLAKATSHLYTDVVGAAGTKSNVPGDEADTTSRTKPVDVIYRYVRLVPKAWGLGDGEYPEKWLFGIAGDQIIIQAQPLGLNHGMYPVAVAAPDYDGYSVTPISRLESIYQMQKLVDWLFTSHVANVRKAINDMIVYDPTMINSADIDDPTPGMKVRLRENAWSQGNIDNYIKQFRVADVTASHMNDYRVVADSVYRFTGAVDQMQGVMRAGGERRSASEARGTQMSALNRLARMAYLIGMQSMQDIGWMMAHHTQQFLSEATYVGVVGQLEEQLRNEFGVSVRRGRVAISPEMLNIRFDVLPRDGTIPGGQNIESLLAAFQTIASRPELAANFDMTRIFLHIMRETGVRNVEQFRVKTASDETVQRQVEAGNIVPAAGGESAEAVREATRGASVAGAMG